MLSYTPALRKISSFFFRYRNSIDIYTEDQKCDRVFYKELFNKLVPGVAINDITPLGPADEVIKACLVDNDDSRPKLYIIDGDINVVIENSSIPQHENLHVLNSYCIENYLVDEQALVNFIYNNDGTISKEEIQEQVRLEELLGEYSSSFIDLFLHFAIKKELGLKYRLKSASTYIKNNKISYELEFDQQEFENELDINKQNIIDKIGETDYQKRIAVYRNKWQPTTDNLLKVVSGKDYLLHLLRFRITQIKRKKDASSLSALKIQLCQQCTFSRLEDLKNDIIDRVA